MSEPPTIAYLGPRATFTHQAAWKAFGKEAAYAPAGSIDEVFAMVQDGRARQGVVPVENSNEGVVTSTMDLLADSSLSITGEIVLPIRLALLSLSDDLSQVKTVFSHPQALAQCRIWLQENLPHAHLMETRSTAEAASRCREEPGTAAVAGRLAGELYRIPLLVEDIGDWAENLTRFIIFSADQAQPTGNDKTSVVVSIKDRVGALYAMIRPFGDHGINLTKIESRPSKKKAWDYVFFMDFEGHREDPEVKQALEEVGEHCLYLKILGSYPKGRVEEY